MHLRLLGAVSISVDGALVDERSWTRRKSKALIKILALAPNHQMHREQLMECLWPEIEPELASNNLHKIIHAARRALEPELKSGGDSSFIHTHDQQVVLRAPVELWIDVESFEQLAENALKGNDPAAYESALELYAGKLLEEDRYEDWATARREQLDMLAQRLIGKLASLRESSGELQQAIELYRRLLGLDAANEETHRSLMRLYAMTGSRHQAMQQYQMCCAALRKELGIEPELATVKLNEEIIAGRIQPQTANLSHIEASEKPSRLLDTLSAVSLSRSASKTKASRIFMPAAALVLAVVAAASVWFYRQSGQNASPDSIAVLPFASDGKDEKIEYLSEGIAESIINSLSRLPQLRVMARTATFRFKGKDIDPQQIGKKLHVRTVLTGRLQQRGDLLVVQADLINVEDGSQLWGAQYSRMPSDIIAVQTEIAREVSDKLRLRLTSEQQQRVVKHQTENIEAYQAYLKGRHLWNQRTVPELQRAIEQFNQAIKLDPGYALAYTGISDCYHTLSNLKLPPTEAVPKARQAALRALELDDQLAAAHASLGVVKWRFDWDWNGAERDFKRAIELDPNYASAHQWYGQLLTYQRRFDAATVELKQAQQLDPLSLIITANLGLPLYFSRQYDQAISQFNRALELDQDFPFAYFFLGWAYEQKGDYSTAIANFRKAVELDGTPSAWAYLGHGQAVSGNRAQAEAVIQKLEEIGRERYVSPYHLAVVYAGLGDNARTLGYLNQAIEDHSDSMVLLNVEPKFDLLRQLPQFREIAKRVGFNQ
ncbi:MAG: tetratricopeptide repeat protein [Blastocatellia bacterium]